MLSEEAEVERVGLITARGMENGQKDMIISNSSAG